MGLEEVKEKKQEEDRIKVLIADDDTPTRILLRAAVSQWGYEVVEASDGEEAWNILQKPDIPELLIVDWLMPKLDGIDLCRRVKNEIKNLPYIILLTQLTGTTNILKGLEAGADEFLSKPFNMAELQSRLSVGARIIHYQAKLANKTQELQQCFNKVNELSTIISGSVAKIDEVINAIKIQPQDAVQLLKLKELQTDSKKILGIIEQLNAEHDQ